MRLVRCICLPAALSLVLGCGNKGGGAPAAPAAGQAAAPSAPAPAPADASQAPARLIYPSDPAVYSKGVAIAPNTPYVTGGAITSYRVNPALPPGLSLNPGTGVISGTPSAVSAAAAYEVTGSNGAGSTSATLTVTVIDRAPAGKPAVTLDPFVTESRIGLAASTPDQGPDVTYAWTLRGGTVTAGQGTPAITYTAGAIGTLTATVTVGNTGGAVSGSAEATVVKAPDATLTLPVAVQTGDGSKRASVPDQPGMTYEWTILPGTSTATLTSGLGTHSVAFQAGNAPGTFQIQVKVQNQAGNYLSTSGTIKVQTGY